MQPIIDAWAQHPTEAILKDPVFESIRRWAGFAGLPDSVPLDLTKGAMAGAGVTRCLLSAWWGPRGPLITNDQVARWVKEDANLFAGVCSVPIERPMDGVRELRRCIHELGFKAVRILPWLWRLPPNDRRFYPIYSECIELGIPFCLQVGHTGPLAPSEFGRPIPYLDDVALEFPELVIVGGHIGYPWTQEMIALSDKYPNVYIDTSAYTVRRYPSELVEYMRGRGKRKVLFGSNYPMILPSKCLHDLQSLELDDETKRLFLHDNAARIFGL